MKKWKTDEFENLKIPMNISKIDEESFVFEVKTVENGEYIHRLYRVRLDNPGEYEYIDEGTMPAVFCGKIGTLQLDAVEGMPAAGENRFGSVTEMLEYENSSAPTVTIAYWIDDSLAVMNLHTKEKKILGKYKKHSAISWSKDGRMLTFTAACSFEKVPEDVPHMNTALWIDRTKFKSDEKGIYDGSYEQVYVVDARTGEATVITKEKTDYANAVFVGDDKVAFTAVLKDTDFSDFTSIQIYYYKIDAIETIPGPGGPVTEVAVESDGNMLYIISHDNRYWEATNFRLYSIDLRSAFNEKKCTEIRTGLDRSIGNYVLNDVGLNRTAPIIRFGSTAGEVYINVTDGFCTDIYKTGNSGALRITSHDCVIMEYIVMDGGIMMIYSAVNEVAKIVYYKAGSSVDIWNENESYEPVDALKFEYPGAGGGCYTGYCMLPAKIESMGNYDIKGLVLDIHGGPHYCHGLAYSNDVHNLVAAGYGVVYCNPAGSQGVGEELARESYHDWGGKDYIDLLNCQRSAQQLPGFEKLPWAVKGGSYGGYMVNWIVAHTDIFTCAVSERSTCNRYSQAGTSDCAFRYGKFEFEGFPWDNCESYMFRSPITYVKNVNTPILLIHGDTDMNCPVSQSEEFYSALKLENKEVYFARFKGQKHAFAISGTPESRKERYGLIVWWLDHYMGQNN